MGRVSWLSSLLRLDLGSRAADRATVIVSSGQRSLMLVAGLLFLLTSNVNALLLSQSRIKIRSLHTIRSTSTRLHTVEPLFNFGLIADIQYVDAPDAMNFQGTMMRRYRQSLNIFQEAIDNWSLLNPKPICALVLGDILDGKTASMNNQYDCLKAILGASSKAPFDIHYCFGNHCHYSLPRKELFEYFLPHFQEDEDRLGGPLGGLCSAEKLYYDFSPFEQWRFISLDSYDISLIGASSEANKQIAFDWLTENNPNDLTVSGGWFNGLPFEKKRWVPYNGGMSMKQLKWLDSVLEKSKLKGEKVVIFCHQPVWSPDKPNSVVWNSEDVLKILWKYDNVFMWIAGHDHDGQYCRDVAGIHHLVPPAPLECEAGEKAYGHIEVFDDHMALKWTGKQPRKPILPWPDVIPLTRTTPKFDDEE